MKEPVAAITLDHGKLDGAKESEVLGVPHGHHASIVADALGVDISNGLSSDEAARRLDRDGPNSLDVQHAPTWWVVLFRQFTSIVVWLLFAAAAVAWFTGSALECAAILVVLVINAAIGFAIEWRANKALAALHYEAKTTAHVRRDGREEVINASGLVTGDIIILDPGERVPADARLIEAPRLRADESTFTGESVPVDKSADPVEVETILADRRSMIYLGTLVTAGRGLAIVTATGTFTELGRIGRLMSATKSERTPLEQKLESLGKTLVYIVLAIAAVVMITGVLRGDNVWLMLEVSISLAVAAVPEALPAMTTLILALGVLEMARQHAIVRRLSAVETLGSTTVICADKTGTLTQNRMTVTEFRLPDGSVFRVESNDVANRRLLKRLLEIGVLCNDAVLDPNDTKVAIGDPTEIALIRAGHKLEIDVAALRSEHQKLFEEPFDPAVKRMIAVFGQMHGENTFAAIKGGPTAVLSVCDKYLTGDDPPGLLDDAGRKQFLEQNDLMASRGLRVLAFAQKALVNGFDKQRLEDIHSGYTFLGFAGMTDPPREGVATALREAKLAGIRTVMLTGDQLPTARAVARELGLSRDGDVFAVHSTDIAGTSDIEIAEAMRHAHVFARVSPEDKLRIVEALQRSGEIVAVTGDGINDAPALKRADIGIAMGMRGTEVAKEAADMVLADDNFSTIVSAIKGGRTIYANIIKFVHMLFSHNLGEVIFIFAAISAGLPLPLLPLQILWVNIVTDIFPAFALAVEPVNAEAMQRGPRPRNEALLSGKFLFLIGWQGFMLGAIVFLAYMWSLQSYGPGQHSRTVALLAMVGVEAGHLFNCRSRTRSAFRHFFSNPFVFAATGIVLLLEALALYFPPLSRVLDVTQPDVADLLVMSACIVLPIVVVEITKFVGRRI